MATFTTVNINGILASDDVAASAVITFRLNKPGQEESVILPDPIDIVLDSSGDGTVSLWSNAAGLDYTFYFVTATFYRALPYTSETVRTEKLGSVYIPATGTPEIGDLLDSYHLSFNEDWGSVADAATISVDYGAF